MVIATGVLSQLASPSWRRSSKPPAGKEVEFLLLKTNEEYWTTNRGMAIFELVLSLGLRLQLISLTSPGSWFVTVPWAGCAYSELLLNSPNGGSRALLRRGAETVGPLETPESAESIRRGQAVRNSVFAVFISCDRFGQPPAGS